MTACDKRSIGQNADTLFWLCFIAYSFSCIGRMNFSACMNTMATEGFFAKTFGGTIMTAYFICYGSGQLINGVFGSKISPKIMISVGLLGAGIANIVMGFLHTPYLFLIVWALNGFFNSMLWAPIIRVFSEWLPAGKRYGAGVWMSVAIPFGTTVSYLLTSLLLRFTDWRTVFMVSGGFVLLALVIWIFGIIRLRGYISEMNDILLQNKRLLAEKNASGASLPGKKSATPSLITVIFSAVLILITICIMFNGALKDGVITWIPAYISEVFGASASTASLVSVILPIVSVLGCFAATFLNRWLFKNEMTTSAFMFALSFVSLLCVFFFGNFNMLAAALLLALSVSAMWGVDTMLLTFVPYHYGSVGYSSAVSGLLDCFAYAASSLCSFTYGAFQDAYDWNYTVLLWCVIAFVGVIVCAVTAPLWKRRRSLYEV